LESTRGVEDVLATIDRQLPKALIVDVSDKFVEEKFTESERGEILKCLDDEVPVFEGPALTNDLSSVLKVVKELLEHPSEGWMARSLLAIYDLYKDPHFLDQKHCEKGIESIWSSIIDPALKTTSFLFMRGEIASEYTMHQLNNSRSATEKVTLSELRYDGVIVNYDSMDGSQWKTYGFFETSRTSVQEWDTKIVGDERKLATGMLEALVLRKEGKMSRSARSDLVEGRPLKMLSICFSGKNMRLGMMQETPGSAMLLHRRKTVGLPTVYCARKILRILEEVHFLRRMLLRQLH